MANRRNMFGTFYGNSSRNVTSGNGMGTRPSMNRGVSMGNGNLVQRAEGGKGRRHQCNCWERNPSGDLTGGETITTWCRGRQSCAQCCKNAFGENYTGASAIQAVGGRRGRNGGSGFGGGSLRDLDISVKMKRTQKQCFCSAPEGSGLGNQTIICNRLRNCTNCCQSRFGSAWAGQDVIQSVGRRR